MDAVGAEGLAAIWTSEPSGTISPAALRDLELRDVLGLAAERRVGLGDHLVGAAEPVEVVDVERAEVDLQRVRRRRCSGTPWLLSLVAVDVDVELRHVDPEAGEHAAQLRALVGLARASACDGLEQLDVAQRRRDPRPAS